ncbi:MAG TPA: hypothetical protein VJR89_37020, partial [Polyangiales bacterium]|nr:hypothetical protein [Polyangiales bacterium]
ASQAQDEAAAWRGVAEVLAADTADFPPGLARPYGFLIAAVSPRRVLDESYRSRPRTTVARR